MRLDTRIGAGFAAGIVILVVVGASAYVSTQQLLDANRLVRRTHEVIEGLERVLSVLQEAETDQRGFVLTGQARYLEPYEAASGQIQHDIDTLADLSRDDAAQQDSLQQVHKLADAKLAELQETVQLRRKSGLEGALPVILTDRGRKIMDELRGLIARMQARERQLLDQRNEAASAAASRTIETLVLWMPLSLLVLAVAAVVLMRTVQFGGPAAPPIAPGRKWAGVAVQYLSAVVAVAVAAALRWRLLDSIGPLPLFITFYPAVLLVASIGGAGPAIMATVFSALAADYWFIPPYGSFRIDAPSDIVAVGIFVGTNLFLSILMERLRRARWAEAISFVQEQRLEELSQLNAELSQQSEELSQQSEELAQQNEELQSQSEEIQKAGTELRRLYAEQQTIFNSVPAMIWFKDTKNNFVRVNREVAISVGKPLDAIEGKSAYEVFPDEAEHYYRDDLEVIRSGQPKLGIVEEMGTASGEKRWVQTDKIPFRDERGEIAGVLVFSVDITERKRLEEPLSRLAAIVESSDDAILSTDLAGVIQTWNAAAKRLFGYRAEEVICRPVALLLPPEQIDEEERILERVRAGQRVEHLETVRVTKDGGRLDVSVTVSPVKDPQGRIIGASKILRDITERKRVEETLRQTAADLARSNKDLELFAYVASHDLREPLRMVTGFMSLLKDHCGGTLDAKADEYIGFAAEGAFRMQGLIDDLLAYARVGRGEIAQSTDVAAVLDGVLRTMAAPIEESAAVITHDPLPTITSNRLELTQVLQNLIGNALKFRGQRRPEIHVGARRQADGWLLTVRDNGIGIDPQSADRIFMIFQRLHTREQYPGTGIGLAICKKVIERHRGQIWVESRPGVGSTFCFTIPDQGTGQG